MRSPTGCAPRPSRASSPGPSRSRSPGTELLEPALPARYEISVGHLDERAAIAAGTVVSASERSKQRHGAASVRQGMPDLLGALDSTPSREDISAWTARISDEGIIDRVSRLRKGDRSDPDIVLHNLRVLHDLRHEVIAFAKGQVAHGVDA